MAKEKKIATTLTPEDFLDIENTASHHGNHKKITAESFDKLINQKKSSGKAYNPPNGL